MWFKPGKFILYTAFICIFSGGGGGFEIGFLYVALEPVLELCRLGWSRTHGDLPASASQVLGLKASPPPVFIFILYSALLSCLCSSEEQFYIINGAGSKRMDR